MKTLNFEIDKIQQLDLETLKASYKENDVFGNPLRDVYHYQVIENVLNICERNGLKYDIQDIFAADNRSKQFPGVSKLPQVAAIHGEQAPEAHILRRVYTTIRIHDGETDELTTNIAIAYHQEGLQVAFGTTVKICRNLCILGAQKIVNNYGRGKIDNTQIFETVENWLGDFGNYQERDIRIIQQMRNITCSRSDVMQLIGMLTSIRVAYDNGIGEVRQQLNNYPLNQAQISIFTENYLRFSEEHETVTLWDVYNMATHIYKPHTTEIPNILPQTAVLYDVLNDLYKLN
ncbi:MAG TPA: DUF3871 family protein [Paludibacter sp.]|nr:DUF3871 family protein [Paludibacter sp.]